MPVLLGAKTGVLSTHPIHGVRPSGSLRSYKIVPYDFIMHMNVLRADNAGAFIGHCVRAEHYQTINKKAPVKIDKGFCI